MRHYTSQLQYMANLDNAGLFDYLKWAEGKGYKETAVLIRAEINTRLYHRRGDTVGEPARRFKISKLRRAEEAGVSLRALYRRAKKSQSSSA